MPNVCESELVFWSYKLFYGQTAEARAAVAVFDDTPQKDT